MRYAVLNETGAVAEIAEFPDDMKIGRDIIHPDLADSYIAIGSDDVAIGSIRDGEGWRAPEPPPVDLAAYAAAARWRAETGGVVVAGVRVATDDRSKMMIVGARLAAMSDVHWTTVWRGADGSAHPLDAAQMIAISDAVSAHVNRCFAAYADLSARIASGEVTTTAQIDAAFAGAD